MSHKRKTKQQKNKADRITRMNRIWSPGYSTLNAGQGKPKPTQFTQLQTFSPTHTLLDLHWPKKQVHDLLAARVVFCVFFKLRVYFAKGKPNFTHGHLGSYWGWPNLSLRIFSTLCCSTSGSTASNIKKSKNGFYTFQFSINIAAMALAENSSNNIFKYCCLIVKEYWGLNAQLLRHTWKLFAQHICFHPIQTAFPKVGSCFFRKIEAEQAKRHKHFNCMEHVGLLFSFKNHRHLKFTKNATNIRIATVFAEILRYSLRIRILLISAAAPENLCELWKNMLWGSTSSNPAWGTRYTRKHRQQWSVWKQRAKPLRM